MAGTITCGTLSDGTNSTSSTNCIQGSAKAWVNFNGTAATIRASYNVTSVTKNGTGDYTVNLTNAMSNANYSGLITGEQLTCFGPTSSTTSAYRVGAYVPSTGINIDRTIVCVAIFSS